MADSTFTPYSSASSANCFKEAVCVSAGRVYDSCSAKDCLEDLAVTFAPADQRIVNCANSVKCRGVEITNVTMDVEDIPFNKGFYSVDITYTFQVSVEAVGTSTCYIVGTAAANKKVILYGSCGNVKNFSSDGTASATNAPTVKVQIVDPIVLGCRMCDTPKPDCNCCIPCCPTESSCETPTHYVYVSVGMFSIVQLQREVQMMIPIYDFCVPDKECPAANTDDPCELFRRIKFPTNEFFPPRLADYDGCCGDTDSISAQQPASAN